MLLLLLLLLLGVSRRRCASHGAISYLTHKRTDVAAIGVRPYLAVDLLSFRLRSALNLSYELPRFVPLFLERVVLASKR